MTVPPARPFCLCNGTYDGKEFAIECSACDRWFHGRCIGLTHATAARIPEYFCPSC
ncbi:hypothetical protein BC828DRAFT_343183, partial [Blastocladiella britannica]